MDTTQDHIPIKDIREDIVIMKNGDMAVVMETTAVNFGLLSEQEQYAIIATFAGLINSLAYPLQILIRSKRLDISGYLAILDDAYQAQSSELLKKIMLNYRNFVEALVRDNDVLDKRFYCVVACSRLEVGISSDPVYNLKHGLTILLPRRDQLVRQLARIGLKVTQLTHKELVLLYNEIYNFEPEKSKDDQAEETAEKAETEANKTVETLKDNKLTENPLAQPEEVSETVSAGAPAEQMAVGAATTPATAPLYPQPIPQTIAPAPVTQPTQATYQSSGGPFVVEELPE